jgi:hypothetical protein
MNDISQNLQVFVHREAELRLALDRLSLLRAGKSVAESILFFHGVPMVGKSALLQAIKQRAIQNLIPTALIDFTKGFDDPKEKVRLVREILRQWQESADIGPLPPLVTEDEPDAAARKLVAYSRQLHQGARPTPVALLLDTVELISHEDFSWLQRNLIEPILDGEKSFMAFAARAEHIELPVELSWPVSRRTRFIALKTFTPEETKDHYKALLGETPPTIWHKQLMSNPNWLTLGVPGLNEIAFEHSFDSEESGVRYMVEQVVFKRIAQGDVAEIQDLILVMSSFRKFDYRVLAQMANHFWPHTYPESSRRLGVQLARKMKATMLMEMRQDGYGYVISPNIRRLLDDYQRFRSKQQHFETHCLSYLWFQEEVSQGDFVSVADQIYHLAGAWFDFRLDVNNELKKSENIPNESQGRSKILLETIKNGMEHISDKSKADTQVDKVLNAFQQEKQIFSWFLSHDEVFRIIEACQNGLDQAVLIADKHDNR